MLTGIGRPDGSSSRISAGGMFMLRSFMNCWFFSCAATNLQNLRDAIRYPFPHPSPPLLPSPSPSFLIPSRISFRSPSLPLLSPFPPFPPSYPSPKYLKYSLLSPLLVTPTCLVLSQNLNPQPCTLNPKPCPHSRPVREENLNACRMDTHKHTPPLMNVFSAARLPVC